MAGAQGREESWFYPLCRDGSMLLMLVLARRSAGGGGGEPAVRGRRVSSLYKVRATSIIISREPRQDGAPNWQTLIPSHATRVIIQTISYFLLFPHLYRSPACLPPLSPPPPPPPSLEDDRRVSGMRSWIDLLMYGPRSREHIPAVVIPTRRVQP